MQMEEGVVPVSWESTSPMQAEINHTDFNPFSRVAPFIESDSYSRISNIACLHCCRALRDRKGLSITCGPSTSPPVHVCVLVPFQC